MHILALIISLITGVISFFQAGLLTMLGGIGGGLGEVFGDQSMADEIYMYGGMGLLVVIAAILGIIGGILAAMRKKAAAAILAVSAGICIIAAISGYSDAFIYALAYAVAAAFAFLSFRNYEQASASNQSSPSSSGDRSLDTKQITSSHLERTCTNCEKILDGDFQFCPNCGEKVEPIQEIPIRKCQNCGKEFEENFQFCPYCGGNIQTVFPEIPVPTRQEGQNIVDDSKDIEKGSISENKITAKKEKRLWDEKHVIGIGLLLLVVGIGFLLMNSTTTKDKNNIDNAEFLRFYSTNLGWTWPSQERLPNACNFDQSEHIDKYFITPLEIDCFSIVDAAKPKENGLIKKESVFASMHNTKNNKSFFKATAIARNGIFVAVINFEGKQFLDCFYCTSRIFLFPYGIKIGGDFSNVKKNLGDPSDRYGDYFYYGLEGPMTRDLIFQVKYNKIVSIFYWNPTGEFFD